MDERWMGFTAWGVAGILMIGIGIWALFSKKTSELLGKCQCK